MTDFLQWPALVLSIVGAYYVASDNARHRLVGFWLFLLSNFAWAFWGIGAMAWAVVISQVLFMFTSCRGIIINNNKQTPALPRGYALCLVGIHAWRTKGPYFNGEPKSAVCDRCQQIWLHPRDNHESKDQPVVLHEAKS